MALKKRAQNIRASVHLVQVSFILNIRIRYRQGLSKKNNLRLSKGVFSTAIKNVRVSGTKVDIRHY